MASLLLLGVQLLPAAMAMAAVNARAPGAMAHAFGVRVSRPAVLASLTAPRAGRLVAEADDEVTEFDYLVIGGGSGGIASARRAASHGATAAVIERARLGGTCVNVGCVPKKVMFNAAFVMEIIHQAEGYGLSVENMKLDMPALKQKRDAYVSRLNGIYRNNLKNSDVTFIEGDASFVGPKMVSVGDKTYTAKNILIAVGGTPAKPPVEGAELAITSDGFFDLEQVPSRVAVVGSGYIAVELAGILNVLGSKVDLFIRGERPLRTMEVDIINMLVTEMGEAGINIIRGDSSKITASDGGKTLHMKDGATYGEYDEILFATGRTPVTESLKLSLADIEVTKKGHVKVDDASRTTADGVFAVGDVLGKARAQGIPITPAARMLLAGMAYDGNMHRRRGEVDLTPVAIAAGRLLADRLYAGVPESATKMDYGNIPTVIFSHPPLAAVGLTETQAIDEYGEDAVTIHKSTFVNMLYSREFLAEGQYQSKTFAKLVCVGDEQRVVGLHMIGLAVDEILQGFSVAIKMGATKADFDSVVAIHPTSSEELVTIPPWQAKYKLH